MAKNKEYTVSYTIDTDEKRRVAKNLTAHSFGHAKAQIANYWLAKNTPIFAGDFKLENLNP